MSQTIGPSPEMYLKTLSELAPEEAPVSIAAVASRLGVSPVSASEMIHRLEARRMVRHRRYRGVWLTRSGREHAVALIRRHRLWECFLVDHLGLAWESVHDAACELEHAAGDEVTDALAVRLGNPDRCPHGNPIPNPAGRLRAEPARPMTGIGAGAHGTLVSVHPETTATLTYLAAHGFLPGVRFTIERIEPTDRLLLLQLQEGAITIGPDLAAHLHVRLD